jgi:ankyrin repeat protein
LVCYSFIGIDDSNKHVLDNIREIIVNYRFTEPEENKPGVYTVIYPDFNFQNIPTLKQTIKKFNNIILREQIDTINNSLELVKSRDMYFKNLLINQFIEKKTIGSIFLYRNILNNRIIKCIEWLRTYKINTHQIVYRYNC